MSSGSKPSINFTVLVDGQPRVLNIKEILQEFIKHRKDVVTKRTKFDLRKAKERGHIVEGLMVAIANIDEVIKIIKKYINEVWCRFFWTYRIHCK